MAKARYWTETDTQRTKARGAKGIRYPCSPSCKRWVLGVVRIDPGSAVANALSTPPGEVEYTKVTGRTYAKELGNMTS